MIETEKAILGISILHRELIPLLIDNSEGLFTHKESEQVYEKIKYLYERGLSIDISVIADLLAGTVKAPWIASLTDGIYGLTSYLAEDVLLEKVRLIKEGQVKTAALKKVDELLRQPEIDFDEIIDICQKAKVLILKKEDCAFAAAYQEYLSWKEMKPTKITTGFPSFDKLTDHFNYGEIVAVMGRTTTGKTFVALNVLQNLLDSGVENIGFFSMEMSKGPLVERAMQIHYGLSRYDLVLKRSCGELDEGGLMKKYGRVKVFGHVYSADEISRLVELEGLRVIFVDYLQLMKNKTGSSLYEKATYNMHSLKELAKNRSCIIFLLIQLSRKAEGGWEPVAIDMARDSGAIEENSDFVIGLWNPSLREDAKECWRGKVCLKLLKNKRGPVVGIECAFNPLTGKLYEIEEGMTV